jgi:hypothetical protein
MSSQDSLFSRWPRTGRAQLPVAGKATKASFAVHESVLRRARKHPSPRTKASFAVHESVLRRARKHPSPCTKASFAVHESVLRRGRAALPGPRQASELGRASAPVVEFRGNCVFPQPLPAVPQRVFSFTLSFRAKRGICSPFPRHDRQPTEYGADAPPSAAFEVAVVLDFGVEEVS